MAVCFVVFNPAGTKRILMNYLYTKTHLESQKIPTFTLELVYDGRTPEIPDAVHVTSKSYMFHKENLYRILETKIPKRYTKLAFLDCDVLFDDASWYYKTSKLLDTYDVVQPFETAHWLDLTYSNIVLTRNTILYLKDKTWNFDHHPGFAWCMKRRWYNEVGFFDYAISGSGDTLSTAAWLDKTFPSKFQSLPRSIQSEYTKFRRLPHPEVTYLEGETIYHLYHGSRAKRKYADRHKMIDVPRDIHQLIKKNNNGVFEWRRTEEWNPMFFAYFNSRDDDDLSEVIPHVDETQTS